MVYRHSLGFFSESNVMTIGLFLKGIDKGTLRANHSLAPRSPLGPFNYPFSFGRPLNQANFIPTLGEYFGLT